MKINFLGDSITAGAGAEKVENMYTTILCGKLGAIENNYGICGTRIARQNVISDKTEDKQDFLVRAKDMDKTADFVFVFGGTNDYGHGDARLGFSTDHTPLTFYGALNILTEYLIETYGAAKLCYILPPPRFDENNPYGEKGQKKEKAYPLSAYRNAIVEIAKKNGIDILDLSDIFPQPLSDKGDDLTMDGLHPNIKGHRLIAEKLFEYLKCRV